MHFSTIASLPSISESIRQAFPILCCTAAYSAGLFSKEHALRASSNAATALCRLSPLADSVDSSDAVLYPHVFLGVFLHAVYFQRLIKGVDSVDKDLFFAACQSE